MISRVIVLCAAVAGLSVAGAPLRAQTEEVNSRRALLSRDSLQGLLNFYAASEQSAAYSAALRASASKEATYIRGRLRDGDFHPGDRILFRNENTQTAATPAGNAPTPGAAVAAFDSLIVTVDRTVIVPGVGAVSVAGVLHSEIESHLERQVTQVQRDAVIRARSFVRITMMGTGIGHPGFYLIPDDALLEQALTLAGGPTAVASLGQLRIERNGERIWDGERLQQALANGSTVDGMGLEAGDRIILPSKPLAGGNGGIQTFQLLLGSVATVIGLVALIRNTGNANGNAAGH